MRRIRALIVLAALVGGVLAGFVTNASPAQAAPHGYMTCHLNVLDEDFSPLSDRPIECYY